jgi:hypothetical protein
MIVELKDYIEWYKQHYGKAPSPNLIEAFKRINSKEPDDKKKEIDEACEEFDFLQ